MTPLFLLVHGWGFDASFWSPLREALPGADCLLWNLGHLGALARPPVPAGRPVVAVGHSFGLLWLLETEEKPFWHSLVSINGFTRFAGGPDFPDGVAPRLIDRMISRFERDPETVYRDFMGRCGIAAPEARDSDRSRLAEGLNGLRHWDARSRMTAQGPVGLVLAGRTDPIVPEGLTRVCFPEADIQWHESGHLLPLEAPAWCAAHLRRLSDGM